MSATCIHCDWPPEWESQDLCIRHSYAYWKFWGPLAAFSYPTDTDTQADENVDGENE